jgi:hypothetical protein
LPTHLNEEYNYKTSSQYGKFTDSLSLTKGTGAKQIALRSVGLPVASLNVTPSLYHAGCVITTGGSIFENS